MVPVPIRPRVPGQDRSAGDTMAWTTLRIHGLASLEGQGLRLKWSGSGALDAVRGMEVKTQLVSHPIEHLIVPLPRMRSIQLAGRVAPATGRDHRQ